MRAILALLLALSVAFAGCADDADDGDTTLPSDNDTAQGNETGSGNESGFGNETGDVNETNETGDGNETADVEPVAEPVEVVNTTFNYSSGAAAGPDGVSEPFDVPEGYVTLTVNWSAVAREAPGGLPGTGGVVVNAEFVLLDPEGNEVAAESPKAGDAGTIEVPATAGTWTIQYEGAGNIELTLVGTVSGAAEDAAEDEHGDHAGH